MACASSFADPSKARDRGLELVFEEGASLEPGPEALTFSVLVVYSVFSPFSPW